MDILYFSLVEVPCDFIDALDKAVNKTVQVVEDISAIMVIQVGSMISGTAAHKLRAAILTTAVRLSSFFIIL